VTVWGDPVALSVMFRVAVNEPAAVGEKITCAVHEAPAASGLPPQLLVWVKRLALAPVLLIALTESVPPPELVMVSGSVLVEPTCVDGKLREVADSFAAGAAVVPVPVSATVLGELISLSAMVNVAPRETAAVGLKVT
jgi:hypothetical protein